MAYDGMYGELSTRGAVSEILLLANQTKADVEALIVEAQAIETAIEEDAVVVTAKADEAAASAAEALVSQTAAKASEDAAELARDEVLAAIGLVAGTVSDKGNVNLSVGYYPVKPASSALWRVTVGGTVTGTTYLVGDILIYSKTVDKFYKLDNGNNFSAVNMIRAGCDPTGVVDCSSIIASYASSKELYFPPGTYLVNQLTPSSNQTWTGAGIGLSKLVWPQVNRPLGTSMVKSTGDITNFNVCDLGFVGNRPYQTTPSSTGQDFMCFDFRAGSLTNSVFCRISIEDFGDLSGIGGGGIMAGATSGSGKIVESVKVHDSVFKNISNVPGVYINGNNTFNSYVRDIVLIDNEVWVTSTNSDQNGFYVLGGTVTPAKSVEISRNRFFISQSIDACVELNYVHHFTIDDNLVEVSGAADCTGILLRENVSYGGVAGNTLSNFGTGCANVDAISLIAFTTLFQQYINITDNVIYGWAVGGTGAAIKLGIGSTRNLIQNNLIVGKSSTSRTGQGIHLSGSVLTVRGNQFHSVTYPMSVGSVATTVVENNGMHSVGDGVVGVIVERASSQAILNLTIRNNTVFNVTSGTPNFISVSAASSTNNRVEGNIIPSTVNIVNPSFLSSWAAIVTPANTGALIAGKKYTFSQGSLGITNGSGFTFGGNLDASSPTAVLGDIILVSANVDLKGCTVTAYVQASGVIRIRIQNMTGADVTVDSATWTVIIVKP